jgi:hypothetical protein
VKDEDIEEMEAWLEKEVTKLIMALVKFNTLTHFHIFYKYLIDAAPPGRRCYTNPCYERIHKKTFRSSVGRCWRRRIYSPF